MRARALQLSLALSLAGAAVLLQAQAAPAGVKRAQYAYRPKSASESTDALIAVPPELALKAVVQHNPNAHIPPQCYTKTIDDKGAVHNPCHACHTESRAPNFINDADLQLSYNFAPNALKNGWTNLFIDWRPELAGVSDDAILSYIRKSNYFDDKGEITLAKKLRAVPRAWDFGDDGKWTGFIADAYFNFDGEGFDHAPDGALTGWRAYAYYPVPGTFWPTNGSMGDALIRLPEMFRQTEAGAYDAAIYKANLAILEASIKRTGTKALHFVGKAGLEQDAGRVQLHPGLFPVGVELLHTVRYLDPSGDGVRLAPRLKELRYARKHSFFDERALELRAEHEARAKLNASFEIRSFGGNLEQGVDNAQGWRFTGFIEDAQGELRPQSFEETVYCIGCHSGTGATDDGIFSFGRKLGEKAPAHGWFHFDQHGLNGIADRAIAGAPGLTEYVAYLERNGAGDELRQNDELIAKFFDASGKLKPAMKAKLKRDITVALVPSKARALALDKAYKKLVERQTFRLGRELVLDGAKNVHRQVALGEKTGVTEPLPAAWKY